MMSLPKPSRRLRSNIIMRINCTVQKTRLRIVNKKFRRGTLRVAMRG